MHGFPPKNGQNGLNSAMTLNRIVPESCDPLPEDTFVPVETSKDRPSVQHNVPTTQKLLPHRQTFKIYFLFGSESDAAASK